jgi:chromosome partitioning protein
MPELVADNPMILENVSTVSDAVSALTESGYARDFLICDTPGSFMEIINEAIGVADVVVVPLRASPFDLLAQEAVLSSIKALGKADRTIFVINMADARSSLVTDALRAIKPWSPNPPAIIANRADYAKAAITARAGVEVNKEAAAEIAALWDAITKVARKADDGKIQRRSGKPHKVRAGSTRTR